MDLITTVNIARPGINSLRTTIPQAVSAYLELEQGDKLQWKFDQDGNVRIVRIVKSANATKKKTKSKH